MLLHCINKILLSSDFFYKVTKATRLKKNLCNFNFK